MGRWCEDYTLSLTPCPEGIPSEPGLDRSESLALSNGSGASTLDAQAGPHPGQIKFNHWAPGFEWWGVYQARVPGRRVPGRVPAYLCNISYASPSSKVTTPARSGDLFHSDSDQIYIYIYYVHIRME